MYPSAESTGIRHCWNLAGVPIPQGQDVDGVSLVPLLQGKSIADRPLFWHYPHYGNQGGEPSSIITEDDWKLIYYHEDGRHELYHLGTDPAEANDVAEKNSQRVNRMRRTLDAWLQDTAAKFPAPDPMFDASKREARWQLLKTAGKASLEQRHASYLQEDFQPNQDWWGSAPQD